jgi:hypothetical protein
MNLESIFMSEVRETDKEKFCMVSLIYAI